MPHKYYLKINLDCDVEARELEKHFKGALESNYADYTLLNLDMTNGIFEYGFVAGAKVNVGRSVARLMNDIGIHSYNIVTSVEVIKEAPDYLHYLFIKKQKGEKPLEYGDFIKRAEAGEDWKSL